MRFSRIRLSDKESRVRTRKAASFASELNEPQFLIPVLQGIACGSPPRHLVLATQPLTKPLARVIIHGAIGAADRFIREVVSPPSKHEVEASHNLFWFGKAPSGAGLLADRPAKPCDILRPVNVTVLAITGNLTPPPPKHRCFPRLRLDLRGEMPGAIGRIVSRRALCDFSASRVLARERPYTPLVLFSKISPYYTRFHAECEPNSEVIR